ncbi:hypothetical protein QTH97_13705 [Variovorax sp. J22R24]|uniref:hypothetical protein n=1 Tax=Variovorax gracilis TaxID=3053502 RepID=UPI002576651F|nr:hypothetical protein [Variovorax sp. J22R24]MDM0105993.1 hypothetical protein [Variovorax sp. J22R24]
MAALLRRFFCVWTASFSSAYFVFYFFLVPSWISEESKRAIAATMLAILFSAVIAASLSWLGILLNFARLIRGKQDRMAPDQIFLLQLSDRNLDTQGKLAKRRMVVYIVLFLLSLALGAAPKFIIG